MVSLNDDKEWYLTQITWIDVMDTDRLSGSYSYDGDLVLPCRSALELVRDTLTTDERAKLDAWDDSVRSAPTAFNTFFELDHARVTNPADEVNEYIDGGPVDIPRSHWWWRPLPSNE